MARRRKTRRKFEVKKSAAQVLIGLLVLAVLTTVLVVVPEAESVLYSMLGISPPLVVPGQAIASPTAVHFIDVGQGDAVLLEENGEFALVDAGLPENSYQLKEYLKRAGVTRLRYVVMTHPHADHYGGMQAVIESIPVDLVILPDFDKAVYPTTVLFKDLLASMIEKGIPAQTAKEGDSYSLGNGTIQVVHDGVLNAKDYNYLSLGLLFEAGDFRYLSTGDGEKANEAAILQSEQTIQADVFKAGHHGSSTSNTYAFVEAVHPKIVVVSCALGNSYGHPHREPMETFAALGCQVLRTDKQGSVVVKPDGQGGILFATNSEEQGKAA